MKRYLSLACLGTMLMGVPMFAGCDDKKDTSKTETVQHNPDGSTTTDKAKSTVDPAGNGSTTIEHKTTGATTQP
jgi:hypothetical protein